MEATKGSPHQRPSLFTSGPQAAEGGLPLFTPNSQTEKLIGSAQLYMGGACPDWPCLGTFDWLCSGQSNVMGVWAVIPSQGLGTDDHVDLSGELV